MSASISEQKAYIESLSRKEVEDGLRKGHPIISTFLFADRAKRMQQNDEAIAALEKAAGIPEPGQDIATKLADYLAQGAGQPGGQPGGEPGGEPGGQMPGGQMPGGPMAPGMPMAGGGLVPGYQNGGDVFEDPEYKFEYDPDIGGRYSLGTPEGTYASGERSAFGDLGRFIGRRGADVYGGGQQLTHGLANLIEGITPGQQFGEDGWFGGRRAEDDYLLSRRLFADRNDPDSYYDPRESGWSGFGRKVLVEGEPGTGIESLERRDITEKAGGGGDPFGYAALTARLQKMRGDAMQETGAEVDLREARMGRSEGIIARKDTIQDLLPTEEQDKLRREGSMLGELSDVLGRRSTDPSNSGFGSIGKNISDYDAGILNRNLATEELMAGLDSAAFVPEQQALQALATQSRAGQAYDDPEFKLALAKYEGDRDRDVKTAVEKIKQRGGMYKPTEWATVLNFLQDPDSRGVDPAMKGQIHQNLVRSMLSGGVSSGDPRLMQLMQGAKGAGANEYRGMYESLGGI